MASVSFLRRSIVSKTVLLSTVVLAMVFGLFIVINQMVTSDIYRKSVEEGIQAKLVSSRQEIDRLSGLMEQKAFEIAAAGQVFYNLSKNKKTELPSLVETYLKATVAHFTDGLGGGLWYEPGVVDPQRRLFGPYVFWDKGSVQFTWDLSSAEYDYPNQSWYTFGLPADWDRSKPREKAIYWTPPYVDTAGSNALMITADAFVHDDAGKIIGLSTVDWSLEAMLATLDKTTVLAGSRSFLIDHNSDTVLNFTGDKSARMKASKDLPWLSSVSDTRAEGVQTFGPVTVDGVVYQAFVTSTQSGFAYGALVPVEELQRPVARQFSTNVVLSSLLALVVLTAIFLMLSWMVRPVRPLVAVLERASQGDLRASETSRKHDEFAVLGRHLQTLLADWRGAMTGFRQLLERSRGTAKTVLGASQTLTGEVAAMDQSTTGLAAQFQVFERELTASAEKAQRIDSLARSGREAVSRQKAVLDGVGTSWQGFVSSLDQLKAETDATREAAASLSDRAGESQKVLFSTLGSIQNIARSAQTIVEMISVINDVAAQTNLLAMNAAIEAAHAGESGRGFSVVASEIRKLAEATSGNAKTISASLQQVLTTIKTTEQSSAATAEAVKGLVEGINQVASSSGDVAAGLESLHHQGDGIQDTLHELGSATDSVEGSSGSIQQISEGMRSDFDRLARESGQNQRAVAALATGLKALEETARTLHSEAEQNQDDTNALERDLARFTIG